MIKCICINDFGKPKIIPEHKWVKEGEHYTIVFTTTVLPQKQLAFELDEINLDESCSPYEYFLAERFAIRESDIPKLHELIKESEQLSESVKDLIKQVNVFE